MNEPFNNLSNESRVSVVTPRQGNLHLLAHSDPVSVHDNIDNHYDELIKKHIDYINKQSTIQERNGNSLALQMQQAMQSGQVLEYDGQRTSRLFHTLNQHRSQEAFDLFQGFYQSGNHFVFDIETVGDSVDRIRPFGLTEISINEYDVQGRRVGQGYNTVVRLNSDVASHLQKTLDRLKNDRYLYNTLPEWEKRSVVDLMRYATLQQEGDSHAFTMEGGIRHHSIIDSVFNYRDEVDHAKLIRHMDEYVDYMQSGLNTMQSTGVVPKRAMQDVARLMQQNANQYFVSYNGNFFDMPALTAFAQKEGVALPQGVKHLDYFNVIRTHFMDSDELKRLVNPDYTGGPYSKDKLAAYVNGLLQNEGSGFHNAAVDVDNTAQVVAATRDHIYRQSQMNTGAILPGFNLHPTHTSWNQEPLKVGQMLFANSGVQAFRDGDESFRMRLDENGRWVPVTDGYNKTVINSRSFYQFAGHQELEDGRHAFRFYDVDRDEYAFVVRQGEHAFQELQDFTQGRFYSWDGLDGKTQEEIRHIAETDRARRRYDRFFSLDGGGRGLTVIDGELTEKGTRGFSGLKRMLANAEIMEEHLNSTGEPYREEIRRLMEEEGLSKNQARRRARDVIGANTLVERMDFDSLWDPVTQQYVFNEAEKNAFFKMHKRLIDELPYLREAVQSIDSTFAHEMEIASQIPDFNERQRVLREVNKKRDRALMGYYQNIIQDPEIGMPTMNRPLNPFESHRLSFIDPETNQPRTLNFETVETARNDLYRYGSKGVEEGNPNRRSVIRERIDHLLKNLHAQNVISPGQFEHYQDILFSQDSPHSAVGEIAIHMRQHSGGRYLTEIEEPSMIGNPNIRNLTDTKQRQFIQQAIFDTQNAELLIREKAVTGKKLQLGEEMRRTLNFLDQTRFSNLNPSNYQAIEDLVANIREVNPSAYVSLAMDPNSNDRVLRAFVYDSQSSISVQNQLMRGEIPTQALQFELPLINEMGTHRAGNMILNAHSIAVRDGQDIRLISSSEQISRGYTERMERIMEMYDAGQIEEANKLARRTLRDQVENMAGIQRNMDFGVNDTYVWADNFSDVLKQSHVKVGNAFIEDLYYNGFVDPHTNELFRLTAQDFYDPDDVFYYTQSGERRLRRNVGMDDIQMNTQHRMLLMMRDWAQERIGGDFTFDVTGLKADHVAKGILSTADMRELIPFGSYYDHARDNLIQYQNAYLINDETAENIRGVRGLSREQLLRTERMLEYEGLDGNQTSINMRTAYMTQDDLRRRVEHMHQSESGRQLLQEVGLLNENQEIDYLRLPRLYEQQGILAQDVAEALSVDNEKRYIKGHMFEVNPDLELGKTIQPGQELGVRIHETGRREVVRYEGVHPAQVIAGVQGDEDLLVRWQTDPFKFMLDGEKMTDTVVDRRFIEALTGDADVAVIINPDVVKHRDFGMLMAGESRLLAEEIRKMNEADAQAAIDIIERHQVGLKWNSDMRGFIDQSMNIDTIEKDAFDRMFAELQDAGFGHLSPVTRNGIRVGILDAVMSKVENYSKVIDETGLRVIGYEEGYNALTGEYEVRKRHGGPDGVQWGHREMGVLRSYNLDRTYAHVEAIMREQAEQKGRLSESRGLAESFLHMTHDERAEITAISASEFGSLPEQYRNIDTYRGTIFDEQEVRRVADRLGVSDTAIGERGFWLELPTITRPDGVTEAITVPMDSRGTHKEIDKIFIPFTKMEDTHGNTYIRNIQQNIARIYEKADAVTKAGSFDDALVAHGELGDAVHRYIQRGFYELSSSQGMLFGDVFKGRMAGSTDGIHTSSASGIFKLMDYDTSERVASRFGAPDNTQFTVISEDMAKWMGVYDDLASGREMYVANVRYPTFHDGAMQFTRLAMDESIRPGEIHTTSFSSMLQNADSDGDYSHIVVMNDEDIQSEWREAHDQTRRRYDRLWEEHVGKAYDEAQPVSISGTIPRDPTDEEYTHVSRQPSTTAREDAAKVGKMTIGRASNLNLYIRQVANEFYANDEVMRENFKLFGEGLEQKLIDAKHGAEPVGLRMIDHIYRGEWDQAFEIDNDYFGGQFQNDYRMREVAQEMPVALQRVRNGLHTPGFKFGTSTGVHESIGVQGMIDLLYGTADPMEFGGDNQALRMFHNYLQGEGVDIPYQHVDQAFDPIEPTYHSPLQERIQSGTEQVSRVRSMVSDSFGGGLFEIGEKMKDTYSRITETRGGRSALIGVGLAVASFAGYNIFSAEKPERHYEESFEPLDNYETEPTYIPTTQNASIQIQASGRGVGRDQLSQAATQGMIDSGMNAGPTRISVSHQDNTQSLNRQWYRDTVREHI